MTENNQQPRPDNAVLGGSSPDLSSAAVLGGIEGAVLRFNSNDETFRILALKQATQYGEEGLDLILQGLDDPTEQVQKTAYLLLKDRTESKVKEKIKGFCHYRFFECLWSSGHSDSVWSVAITPDGKTLVSGSQDQTIKVWDITTGVCLKTLEGHSSGVLSVAITPDGKTLVSGSNDNTIKVWDIVAGRCLNTLEGHSSSFRSVAITPDGKTLVSGSWDKTIKVWGITE